MADPSFNSDERVLIRTPGILIKSIPFEGTLTSRRIILTDREKNILPTKDIPLSTVQRVGVGENPLRDPVLNISVIPRPGEVRQMVLTFSQHEGGNRAGERDEWARLIQDYLMRPAAPPARAPKPAPPQPRYEVVNTPVEPAQKPAPAAEMPPAPPAETPAGETVFCTRCGNRVPVESAFCNRCGTPIVAPAGMRQAPPQQPRYAAPPAPVAPAPEPAYQPPAPAPARYEEPAPSRQTVPRPLTPPAPPKAAKKGLLSGLFSSKRSKPAATHQPRPHPADLGPKKSRMPGKKTIMIGVGIIVVIAIVAAVAIFVLPMLSSVLPSGTGDSSSGGSLFGGSSDSSSAPLTNTGVASITVKETTPVSAPAKGVWVKISYLGGYKGTYGMPSDLQNAEDSGDKLFEVVNGTGTIQATIEKKDSSSKRELVVEIYNNGKLLKSGKTSVAYGKVAISADAGASAATAVSGTAGSGNVTATGNATATTAATVRTTTAAATTTKKT